MGIPRLRGAAALFRKAEIDWRNTLNPKLPTAIVVELTSPTDGLPTVRKKDGSLARQCGKAALAH